MGFFGRKRKGEVSKPQSPQHQSQNIDLSTNESSLNTDYAVHMQSKLEARRNADLEAAIEMGHVDSKKPSMGDLVRKLNCIAPKKQNATLEKMMHVPSARRSDSSKSAWGRGQDEPKSEITRPVLVTVKDGDMPYVTPANEFSTIEMKNSFVIGQRTPEWPEWFSQRTPFQSKSAADDSKCKITVGQSPQEPSSSYSPFAHESTSERDLSRQGRWKKGIQKNWTAEGAMPSLVTDHEEESVMTGFDTVGTGQTGYTTDVTDATDASEESDDSPEPRLGGYHRSSPPRIYSSPARGYGSSPPRQDMQGDQGPSLWAGVAEDMGIIAGLLLSDGSACISSAALITKETISSCRNET